MVPSPPPRKQAACKQICKLGGWGEKSVKLLVQETFKTAKLQISLHSATQRKNLPVFRLRLGAAEPSGPRCLS